MGRRILILGPHGAGKSTLVRQVMSLYERRSAVPGGVGLLPMGYELHHVNRIPKGEDHYDEQLHGKLVVVGNYEESRRDQYGMHQFERYRSNFMSAIRWALSASTTCPVLMEGGFSKTRRLTTEEGKKLCDGAFVIWLCPANALRCARDSVTGDQWSTSYDRSVAVACLMEQQGAELWRTHHRETALKMICDLVDVNLSWRDVAVFQKDYR